MPTLNRVIRNTFHVTEAQDYFTQALKNKGMTVSEMGEVFQADSEFLRKELRNCKEQIARLEHRVRELTDSDKEKERALSGLRCPITLRSLKTELEKSNPIDKLFSECGPA